jgi:cytochrome c-type biogenesis protein CcmE
MLPGRTSSWLKKDTQVPVRFPQCVVPDTFKDVPGMEMGVTVEGELLADNTFLATKVLAKCPSKYDMKEQAAKGAKMPHPLEPQQVLQ